MHDSYRICVIPGDGIGNEVVPQALRVLNAAAAATGFRVEFDHQPWGSRYYLDTGRMMPADAAAIVADADATLFGAVGSPEVSDRISAWGLILSLRQQLELYLNLRPVRSYPQPHPQSQGGPTPDFSMLIVRENTEGEYVGSGGRLYVGTPAETATHTSIFTRRGIERAVEHAFTAVPDGGLVTSVTKSNALPHTMGLWDEVTADVAARHPVVRWERMHVDAVAYQMVRAPHRFDVIVASNLFGDILSDIGAGLQGTLGLAASGNVNPQTGVGIFEPVHGSAPDIAGRGVANPLGAINSAALLLDHIGQPVAADLVRTAVTQALAVGVATPDLGGSGSTTDLGDAVLAGIEAGAR
ncbi:MAG TPA: isocitrate/isopropylmalate dehydrogenase family protein [Actinophytocola sp.]|nr:isocitrate/isopropylmalate dehydrogenase family protein [Actinophytocola sp.]